MSTSDAGADKLSTADLAAEQAEGRSERVGRSADEERTPLLGDASARALMDRWDEIQAQFVDSPRESVEHADALVAEAIHELTRSFADERAQLESQWEGGEDVATEELRQALRRYRSFFHRLLAA
jgi:hypothetical protein